MAASLILCLILCLTFLLFPFYMVFMVFLILLLRMTISPRRLPNPAHGPPSPPPRTSSNRALMAGSFPTSVTFPPRCSPPIRGLAAARCTQPLMTTCRRARCSLR